MEQQHTIQKSFTLEGIGLQTGKPVKLSFYPGNKNEGIIFARNDLEDKPVIRLYDIFDLDADRRSRIGLGKVYVETVEHILAALWGAEIDNVKIELDAQEPPALDGSAASFLEALKRGGIKIQDAPREFIEIKEPIWVEGEESFLGIFPSNTFKISYKLEYTNPSIGKQFFSKVLDIETFEKEIAPARTFCLKEEVDALLSQGYGKGGNLKNTLVIDKDGPVDNVLRFPDEPVRHKVLDLVGDLYLLCRPLRGRVIAIRSGHKLNLELIKRIKEHICK